MKPFNLEQAVQLKALVTRGGKRVTDFYYFGANKEIVYPVCVVLEGEEVVRAYDINGRHCFNAKVENELMMETEKKTMWMGYHDAGMKELITTNLYNSKQELILEEDMENPDHEKNYWTIIPVEIEV